jgi:hypothetical protein
MAKTPYDLGLDEPYDPLLTGNGFINLVRIYSGSVEINHYRSTLIIASEDSFIKDYFPSFGAYINWTVGTCIYVLEGTSVGPAPILPPELQSFLNEPYSYKFVPIDTNGVGLAEYFFAEVMSQEANCRARLGLPTVILSADGAYQKEGLVQLVLAGNFGESAGLYNGLENNFYQSVNLVVSIGNALGASMVSTLSNMVFNGWRGSIYPTYTEIVGNYSHYSIIEPTRAIGWLTDGEPEEGWDGHPYYSYRFASHTTIVLLGGIQKSTANRLFGSTAVYSFQIRNSLEKNFPTDTTPGISLFLHFLLVDVWNDNLQLIGGVSSVILGGTGDIYRNFTGGEVVVLSFSLFGRSSMLWEFGQYHIGECSFIVNGFAAGVAPNMLLFYGPYVPPVDDELGNSVFQGQQYNVMRTFEGNKMFIGELAND